MKLSSFLAATAAVLVTAAEERTRCGVEEPSEDIKALLADAVEQYTNSRESVAAADGGAIDTYVHIVTTEANEGKYTQAQIDEQVWTTRISTTQRSD